MTASLNLAGLRFSSSIDRSLSFPRRSSIRAVAAEAIETRRPAASLYEVLRVERGASPMEIKTAYRSLAKIYHPDTAVHRSPEIDGNGGDFIQIRNAYETLSDPSARETYDLSLTAAHGGRHCRNSAPLSRNRSSVYVTRRWETDQCW